MKLLRLFRGRQKGEPPLVVTDNERETRVLVHMGGADRKTPRVVLSWQDDDTLEVKLLKGQV